jgi:hypothetical protein
MALIFSMLFTCSTMAANYNITQIYDADSYITQANDAYEKGFISAKDLETYKNELGINIMSVDYGDYHIHSAYQLNMLGLLDTTGNGYELSRTLTRVEGVQIVIMLFGKEVEAQLGVYSHPFTDIPASADSYIGYAYEKGLIDNTENNLFGSTQIMNYKEYVSLILRALGYKNNVDFTWNNIEAKAVDIGLPPDTVGDSAFLRAHMIQISRNVLDISFKDSIKLLKTQLIENGIISKDALELMEMQIFKRYFSNNEDLTSEVMWKYYKMYDFISYDNNRNGPTSISYKSYKWPNSDIELNHAGDIIILYDYGEQVSYDILKNILSDLEINNSEIDACIKKLNNKEKYQYFEYCKRVIDIEKLKNCIRIDFYLEFEK